MSRKAIAVTIVLVTLPTMALALMSASSKRAPILGVEAGLLTPCPSTPNCVGTQVDTPEYEIDPIRFTGSGDEAMRQLKSIIHDHPRAKIITAENDYLRSEFRSPIFRFVDDVEFLVDEDDQVIHFRSASRIGHSDLGLNGRRMESIRTKFQQIRSKDHHQPIQTIGDIDHSG